MSQKFVLFFVAALSLVFLRITITTAFNNTVNAESSEAERHIQSACEAAVNTMDKDNNIVLGCDDDRLRIRKAFWRAYCKSNGYAVSETGKVSQNTDEIPSNAFGLEIDDKAKYEIPCVIYTDRDGYYVEYTRFVKNDSNGQSEYKNIYTGKQSYSKDYGSSTIYHVEYTLGNTVTVTKSGSSPKKVSGEYSFCYDELGQPNELKFMEGGRSFMDEHDECIQSIISGVLNYCINEHNEKDRIGKKYVFAMPNSSSSFGRMMRNPSVVSFTQGKQSGKHNIYGFAGASIEKNRIYYTYQYNDHGTVAKCYTDDGSVEKIQVGTMRELAKDGALPDLH